MAIHSDQSMRNMLRLGTGLIMFIYVTGHLLNHALGLISVQVMQSVTAIFVGPWRTVPGMILLGGALVIHMAVALSSFWRRRNFRLKTWEAVQLVSGLAIPPLLAAHVAANGILPAVSDYESSYLEVLATFAVYAPLRGIVMALALLVVWTHGCVGLHSWLQIKPRYMRIRPLCFGAALVIPSLALAGYLAASMRVRELTRRPEGLQIDYSGVESWMEGFVYGSETAAIIFMAALVAARLGYGYLSVRRARLRMVYSPGERTIPLQSDATLLESVRAAGISHASICGGRGRCTTCRVHVGKGGNTLPPPGEAEKRVLARVTSSPSVRLACQIRPTSDIEVVALVPHDADPGAALAQPDYQQGKELRVSVLFVDLRDSTRLCEERLPFDVVFVLNQFFSELSAALAETGGHYAQFNGDGLMAIYGLNSDSRQAAVAAISGALEMLKRLENLNGRLKYELSESLQIGIGIHTGEAIVGSMGPPASPSLSALGDNVNVTARLESETKNFGVPLVISAETAELSGLDFSKFKKHRIQVKGRRRGIEVYAVDNPGILEADTSKFRQEDAGAAIASGSAHGP
jgi:adenylate cyclase